MKLEHSAFDSQHYDLRIARLLREPADREADLDAALDVARRDGYHVAFLRLDDGDAFCESLAKRGEAAVDTLVTSTLGPQRRTSPGPGAIAIEHHDRLSGGDVEAVAAITDCITTSHLHADRRLPLARTRELYAAWARNDVTGRAQRVIVARSGSDVAGYISVLVRAGTAVIDLVAVAAARHGQGIGSAMLASFIEWVDERELSATVGTQATNPALGLYARHGFVPTSKHLTYHLWLR